MDKVVRMGVVAVLIISILFLFVRIGTGEDDDKDIIVRSSGEQSSDLSGLSKEQMRELISKKIDETENPSSIIQSTKVLQSNPQEFRFILLADTSDKLTLAAGETKTIKHHIFWEVAHNKMTNQTVYLKWWKWKVEALYTVEDINAEIGKRGKVTGRVKLLDSGEDLDGG